MQVLVATLAMSIISLDSTASLLIIWMVGSKNKIILKCKYGKAILD